MEPSWSREAMLRTLGPTATDILAAPGVQEPLDALTTATTIVGEAIVRFARDGSAESALKVSEAALTYFRARMAVDTAMRRALIESVGGVAQ